MRISDWSSDVCSSDLLREEIAIDSQLLVHITGEVGVLQHVFAHIQEHGIHQPYHAVHMRLEGGGQVHRVVEIGRASCRERVCQYVYISVVAVSLKKKENITAHEKNK